MFAFRWRWLLAACLLFCSVPPGSAIDCYSCDSIEDENCNDPFNFTLFKAVSCTNENFACVKQDKINKELNRTYLYRGCIQKHYCQILAKAADFCITCTTDFCNSSPTTAPLFAIITSSALLSHFLL